MRAGCKARQGQWIPDVIYRPGNANVIAMFFNLMVMLAGARLLVTRAWAARIAVLALICRLCFDLSDLLAWWVVGYSRRAGCAGRPGAVSPVSSIGAQAGVFYAPPAAAGPVGGALAVGGGGVGGYSLYQRTLHPSHGPVSMARADYWPPAWEAFLSSPWLAPDRSLIRMLYQP
jgi:hypothetical protein